MESSDYSKPDNDDSSIDSLMNLLSDSQPSNSIDLRHRLARRIEQLSQNALQSTILQQAFPLIIQLLHPNHELTDESVSQTLDIRRTAQKSLQRIISLSGCRRQKRVFESLDQICTFCDVVYESEANSNHHSVGNSSVSKLQHPLQPMCSLMKLSFDETYRSIIWQLGGVQSITELFICDNRLHSNQTVSSVNLEQRKECVCLRRYVCMALTNLTFGDRCCKSVVCNQFNFLSALLQQLPGTNDELLQVIASLIRNLSWRPTRAIRVQLQQANVAGLLMKAIIRSSVDKLQEQTTVKCVLLALWNLSSTCPASCRSICQVAGSLRYLIQLLRCECTHGQPSSSSTSLTITNGSNATVAVNAAALLRNLATVVVTQRRWRSELRSDGGLTILLRLLRATSLSMVAAVLGILWPLSSCSLEARYLRQSGAIHMLRGLIWSKHAQIAAAARATLCNLLLNRCVEQETLNPPANSNRPEGSQRIEGELMKLHSDEIQDNLNRNLAFDSKHDRLRSPQLNQSNPVSIRMLRSMSSDLPKNPSDSFVIPMSVNQDDAQQRSQNSVLSASLISLSSYERNQTMIKAPSLPYDNAEALDGRQASKMSQSVMMSTNVLGQSDGGWWSSACLDTHWSNSEPVLGNQVICDHSRRIWRNIQRMQMDSIHMNDHDERDEEEESQEVDESFSINDGDSNLQCFNALDNLLNQNHSNDLKLLRMPFPSDAMQGQTDEKQSSFGLDHPIEYELRKDALFTTIGPEQTVFRAYPVIIGNSCDKLNAIDQSVNSSFVIDAIGTDQSSVGHVVINNEQASEDEQSIEQLLGVSALDVTVLSACLRDNDSLPKVPAETEQTQAQLNKKISKSFEKSLLKLNKTQSNDISAQSKPDANQFSQLFERDHPIRLIQRTTSLFSIHCFAVHNYIFKSKSLPKLIS